MSEELDSIARDIKQKFTMAEKERTEHEERWARAYHNFRGKYYKDIKFTENEKSRVFIKVTKTKVLAAYGQMMDLIDTSGRLPITVRKTEVPDTGESSIPSMEAPMMQQPPPTVPFDVGFAGDGRQIPPGATFNTLSIPQTQPPMSSAPATGPDVDRAAKMMEKTIHDQLDEVDASTHIKDAIFESVLLGTGVIKGPFNIEKERYVWKDGVPTSNYKTIPSVEYVPIWNIYPDPQASAIEECDWIIQRHKMNRSELLGLKNQSKFNADVIDQVVLDGPNYVNREFELETQAEDEHTGEVTNRWEVLEYWGIMDVDTISKVIPENSFPETMDVQINAWECNGKIIRLVLNPFQPSRIPYLFFPYEKNPYSIWGIGVAENMDDTQQLMNGQARMAIDNMALAGNLVFDIDESALAPGQDMEVYPGKKFIRQSGMPGQAIYGIKFPNTAHDNMLLFDRWRQLADESTGIPSFSHGNTGVSGMTRTASGMSMLMGAANLNIKTAVKNIDNYLFAPLGKYFFYWNMQFNKNEEIKGDLEVKAEGSKGLIQKEVKSQRLLTLLQLASNPMIAPMVNVQNLVLDIAYTLDADAKRYVNDPEEARRQAEIVGLQQQQAAQQEAMLNGETGNGDGNIGTGKVPQPGEDDDFDPNDTLT